MTKYEKAEIANLLFMSANYLDEQITTIETARANNELDSVIEGVETELKDIADKIKTIGAEIRDEK